MQKFNKGDVIVKNNKFYIAHMTTEEGTLFKAYSFRSFLGSKYDIAGCGGEGDVKCNDTFLLGEREPHVNRSGFIKELGRYVRSDEGSYPIVGNYLTNCCGSFLIDYNKLRNYYPDIYKEFLVAELEYFVEDLVPVPEAPLRVVHKSKSKPKKNANKRSSSKNKNR